MVALGASRGIETPETKLLMRLSVLLCDALLFLPAIVLVLHVRGHRWERDIGGGATAAVLALLCPPFVLIDSGHFQSANRRAGESARRSAG